MPPKKTASEKSTVSPKGKITGFFAPKPSPKVTKRRQTDDVMTDLPPAKRSHDDDNSLTEEQHDQVAQKKLEAETKLLSKKLGVDNLDSSWVKAIYLEFKKPYFTEVLILRNYIVCLLYFCSCGVLLRQSARHILCIHQVMIIHHVPADASLNLNTSVLFISKS